MKRRLINLLILLMLICMGSTDVWAATGLAAVNDATNELILHVDGSSVPLTFDSETGDYTVVARMEIHSEFYFTDSNGIVYGSSGGDDAYVTPSTTPTLQPNGEPFYSVSGAEYSVTLNADLQMSVSYIGMVDIDPGWEINGETTAMDDIIGTKYLGKFEPCEFTITQEQLDAIGGVFKFCLRNYAMNKTYMADADHCLITSTNCTNLPLHYSYTGSPYTYYFEIRQPGTYKVFLNYSTTQFSLSVESDWPTTASFKLGRTRTNYNGTNTNYYPIYYDEDTGTYKLTVTFLLQKGDIYWIEDAEGNQYGGNGSTTLSSSSPEISLLNLEDDGQLLQWASPPCEHLSMTVDEDGLPLRLKGNIWTEPGIYLYGNPSGWEYKNELKFVERYGHPGEYMFTGNIEGGGGQFYISKMDEDGSGTLYTSPYESLNQENSTDVPMSGGYAFTVPEGYYTLILNFNETTPTITISGWPGYYIHGMATEMWSYLNEYKFTEVADMPGIYRLTAEIKQPKFGSTTFYVADKKLENSQSATSCFLGATTTSGSGTLVLTEDNATNVPLTIDGNSFEMGLGTYTFELNTNSDTPTLSVVGWGNEPPTSTYEMAYDYTLPGWVFEYDAETDSYFTVQTVEAGKEFWVDIDGGEIHCTHSGNVVIDKNHPYGILLVPNGDGGTLTMPESGTYTFRFKVTANGLLFSVEWPVPNYYLTDEIRDDNTGELVERKIPFTYKGDGVYELNDIEFEQDHSFWFKRELNGEEEYYGNLTGDLTVTPKDMNLVISSWHTSGNLSMGLAGTYSLIINEQDGSSILTVRFPMQQITIAYDFSERGAFTYDAATNTYSLEFTADAGKPIWFLNKTQGSIIQVPEEITLDRNNSNNISLIEGDDANSLYLSNGGRFTFKLKPTENGYLLNVVWPEPDYMLTYGPTSPGYNSSTPFTRNGDGNWTLEVNFADARDFLHEIDEKDLLFTGTGYSVEEIYFVDEGVKVPVWTNDGWLGEINWSSKYRFGGIRTHAPECCYIFPQDVWEKMKSQPFFVTIKGASPSIRITTGWWSPLYTASLIEPGNDKLTRNGDGCWTAELTVTEDWANDNLFTIGIDDLSLYVDGVSTMYGYGVPYDYSHPTKDNCQNIPLVCGDGSYSIKLPAGTYPLTINPDHTLSIDWPFEQQKFYIAGTMTNNYDWLNMEEMVYNEQTNAFEYEFTVEDSPVFFSITDKMLEENDEAHWNDMNANHRYAPAFDYATELTQINTPIQLQKQKGEMKITVPGTYKISLDSDFKLSVTGWTEQTTDMVNIITNGDLEGDDMSCFFKVESPSVDAVPATYTAGAGKNGSRGIVIQSNDNPTNEWDTQFLIRLPQTLPAGTKYRISFDCKASQTASGTSQIHAEPQQYITWDAFGSVNFTTEWQHFEATGTLTDAQSPANKPMQTFALILSQVQTATTYYFDNIVVEIEEEQNEDEVNIVTNSDLEGDDMSCFFKVEYPSQDIVPATYTAGAGKNGSRGIVIHSNDNPTNAWNTQFLIRLTQTLPAGTKYRISFDCKADQAATSESQTHAEPGEYIYFNAFGMVNFTTEWQHFEASGTLSDEQSPANNPMRTFCLILSKTDTATTYYFDNIKVEIENVEMVNLIDNGDVEGSDMSNFLKREMPLDEVVPATYTAGAGKNGSRGIVVHSLDNPAELYDTQFFIRLPQTLPAGTKYHISFDCKADQAASGMSQTHTEPLGYIHWDAFGTVNFTTEWQHFEASGTLTETQSPENNPMRTFCILLANTTTANNYYFDNIVVEIDREHYVEMVNLIDNGDVEGSDMSNFLKREMPLDEVVPATYTAGAGKNGSRGIVVHSLDNPAELYDTQFFIRLPQTLPAGTRYHISFDCKADQAASGMSQTHTEPLGYIHYDAFGSVNFTTEWQHFEATGTLTETQSPENNPMRTFCILLANTTTANNYYFDNIVIEIDKNQVVPFAVVEEAPTAKDLTYTGSAQELVNPGDASGGTMQYSLDGTNYSPDIPTGTDVGEYIVYYKVVGDADHSDTEPATVSVTIEEAGQEIELTDISQLENTIYLEPHDIRTGSQSTLSFKMKNNVPIRGFQFDLYMPEGLTTATSSNGKVLASLDATRLPEGDEHQLTISIQDDGAIRFLCNSQYDENFATGDDIVLTLKVDVSEDMPEGDYPIDLKKIKLSESNINNSYPTSLVRSKVTVSSYVPGDVNGDGEVDISDYISVANYIHGNSADGFIFKAGDVNGDGEIDITDYIGISNIIHTGSPFGDSQAGAKAAVFLSEESQELDPE